MSTFEIRPGDELVLITWLDRARRDVLSVHPRGDVARAPEGVFSTRLEAIDGTPIVDLKPVLSPDIAHR